MENCGIDYSGTRLSWRVPHTPKTSSTHHQSNQSTPNRKAKNSSPSTKSSPSKHHVFTPSYSLPDTSFSSTATNQNKLWNIWGRLFANVNTAVDELYALCEDEADEVKCREAVDMFERCRLDFDQLIGRIIQQAKFEKQPSGGVSWDVRKPVYPVSEDPLLEHASPKSSESSTMPSPLKMSSVNSDNNEVTTQPVVDASSLATTIDSCTSVTPSSSAHMDIPAEASSAAATKLTVRTCDSDDRDTEPWLVGDAEVSFTQEAEAAWREAEAAVDAEDARESRLWRRMSFGGALDDDSSSSQASPRDYSPYAGLSKSGSLSSSHSLASPKRVIPHYRILHEKLSHPSRSPFSPQEQKERHERAEANRLRSGAEKMRKLQRRNAKGEQILLDRKREKKEKEDRLEERMRDGERRHDEWVKSRRDKASDVTLKVNEVQWINALNAEEVKGQLQARLNDIEHRVSAASDRRQERLLNISGKQRRYHSHKSQQMSSLRLRIETERMERWERLQSRIEDVRMRREQRLLEVQRRATVEEIEEEEAPLPFEEAKSEESSVSSAHRSAPHKRRKKKSRKKGGYSQQIRSARESTAPVPTKAMQIVQLQLQKKTVQSVVGSLLRHESVRSTAAEDPWVSQLQTCCTHKDQTFLIELRDSFAAVESHEEALAFIGSEALTHLRMLLEKIFAAESVLWLFTAAMDMGLWTTALHLLARLPYIPEYESLCTELSLPLIVNILCLELTLLNIDSTPAPQPTASLEGVVYYFKWLLNTSVLSEELMNISVSYIFASGTIAATALALERVIHGSCLTDHVKLIESLCGFLASTLRRLRPPVDKSDGFESDQADLVFHPKWREWVNVLNSDRIPELTIELLSAVNDATMVDEVPTKEAVAALLFEILCVDPNLFKLSAALIDLAPCCRLIAALLQQKQATDLAIQLAAVLGRFCLLQQGALVLSTELSAAVDLLCELPIEYFICEVYAATLLPPLVAITFSCGNVSLLKRHIHHDYFLRVFSACASSPVIRELVSRSLPTNLWPSVMKSWEETTSKEVE